MRKVGLEPTCIYALPPQDSASTKFRHFRMKKTKDFLMTRSLWKGPFVDAGVFYHPFQTVPRIWSRRSVILPQFIDEKVFIHNGKTFISLLITEDMVGHKFGEFAMTRKRAVHKKKVKKKK